MSERIASAGDWRANIERQILQPAIERSLAHPFFAEAEQGKLPLPKIAKWCADMLWITVRFPGIIAALASRCPAYDHIAKALLLENAYGERTHPPLLANALRSIDVNPDRILNGPLQAYRATRHSEAIMDFLTVYAYHHPFVEGICGIGVGMEALTPYQCEAMYNALRKGYGFSDTQLQWLVEHCGDVEKKHAATALMLAEAHIRDDEVLRGRCEYAVQRGAYLVERFPQAMYEYDGALPSCH